MRILVVDRDEMTNELIKNHLEGQGHEVVIEPDRNKIYNHGDVSDYGAVFLDLTALRNPIKYVSELKSQLNRLTYIVFLSQDGEEKKALKAGANTLLKKPIDKQNLDDVLEKIERFGRLYSKLRDTDKRFSYHKGIISNSAMGELFLASLDRTSRYVEGSSLLHFTLKNSDQIREDCGENIEQEASQWMANTILRLRRQSDIMARVDDNEYMILIQRPLFKEEPVDAARRFRASFIQHPGNDIPMFEGEKIMLNIGISVFELPGAQKIFDDTVNRP